ncbi:TetR family transcriptional regulator [Leifsonia sp. LS1]|uniref:TetR/AcrR family transcriptional regulator n=1 Tax=Leifsonia sp. LS1 TaxID=2828483 RepID=UPI001CFE4395|nr:TetR/AcrR family transcriptional regulator [Leifsonia sp. LS1]GIT78612.1 TetR family transcriptional regulator [Leifsonia sp. LS1]
MSDHADTLGARRGRSAKAPLTSRSIVEAALGLIEERGADAVALRHVAERVETGAASLYAYFTGRDALLEHVLDAAYAQVELVEADGRERGWREALADTIANTITTLERYAGLGSVALGTIPVLPGALRLAEHELSLMEHGGVPGERAALGVDLIAQFAASSAIERTVRASGDRGAGERQQVLSAYENADPERFPRVRRQAALLTGPDERTRRDFAIRALIAGIERTAP